MRTARVIPVVLALTVFSAVFAGCAARQSATTAAPSHAELPTPPEIERTLFAAVGVEGEGEIPPVQYVTLPPEPPLTSAERSALGEDRPLIDWLEFYEPVDPLNLSHLPYGGGVDTHHQGMAGTDFATHRIPENIGHGAPPFPITGVDPVRAAVASRGPRRTPPSFRGPAAGVDVSNRGERSTITSARARAQP